ncbi:MAG: YesU family protein [Candidatus Marinimicrobia bacterium]|nr:YesU family protein [Candidatus Neomarinimicrobiota bacterium]
MSKPRYRYLVGPDGLAGAACVGAGRLITARGRGGVNLPSVHGRLEFPAHTLAGDRGALTLWLLALDDLAAAQIPPHTRRIEPDSMIWGLLADTPDRRNLDQAGFALVYTQDWGLQLRARFVRARSPSLGRHAGKALAGPDDFHFRRGRWYQIGLSWDKPRAKFLMCVNGVTVYHGYLFRDTATYDPCGPTLYGGHPAFALSELSFYERWLSAAELRERYRAERVEPDDELDAELARTHAGVGLPACDWQPDAAWHEDWNLPLNRAEDLAAFHVQGMQSAPAVTPEGLRITTSLTDPPTLADSDREQVYLWSRRTFAGDLALELEFKLLRPNGLALLMLQAAGMQREDFMADYPLRETGSMRMVCWENVRNYHWEFYREMDNCRHDTSTHLLVKNPWMYPLAFGCGPARLAQGAWHRLRWIQEGPRLRGVLDGLTLFDVRDSARINCGPVYDFGRLALRCMWKTDLIFRNLRVWTRPPPYHCDPLPATTDHPNPEGSS